MLIQLSVFVENKFGRMAAITEILQRNNINIQALVLADSSSFGILRLVVDKPEEAKKALTEEGITVKTNHVVAAYMEDTPGGLNKLLKLLTNENINIEYMYSFLGGNEQSVKIILRTEDNQKTVAVFQQNGVKML